MVAHDATWSRPEGALYLDISFVLGFWWCGLSLAANLAYFVAAPLGDLRTARLWYDPVLALALFYPGVWLVCPYSRRFSWHQVGSMAGAAIADFETAQPRVVHWIIIGLVCGRLIICCDQISCVSPFELGGPKWGCGAYTSGRKCGSSLGGSTVHWCTAVCSWAGVLNSGWHVSWQFIR